MKVNVEIDCTPLEARQFFGLPELVHFRSQDRRALSGYVRDHGRPRRRKQEQEIVAAADERAPADEKKLRAPGLFWMLAEARSLFELNSSLLLSPLLLRAPKGDGHPVLTLPGFLASDLSMAPMRRYLKELGYDAYAWNMGRNLGGLSSLRGSLRDLLKRIHETTGRKVSIVGWSLGEIREAIAGDLPVPATSIYSRTDGIVNHQTCLLRPSETAENIEVYLASHVGLGVNPAALWAVADRLAQAEGEFRQFNRSGPFAIAYAPPENAQS